MSILTIIAIFVVTLVVALIWGVRWAYVAIFLPVLVLLNQLPAINIQHATITAPFAPMFAILFALPFQKEPLRFRWCSTDTVVALLMLSGAITGWTTEFLETGVNVLRNDVPRLAMPYFLGRIVFQDWRMRRAALGVMVGIIGLVSVCALIEFRMIPYFYLHLLQSAGMKNPIHAMAYSRYGFFRVSGPVEHPIFFGNMAVVFLGMVAVLARTSGVRLTNPWVLAALVGSIGCVVVSISYTPYMGLIAGSAALGTLMAVPLARRMLLPLTLSAITVLFAYTYYMAVSPLEDRSADAPSANNVAGSMNTRKLIVHQSWPKAVTAGPFGWGLQYNFTDDETFDLSSVDNSYMQFTMTRGWVYTALWIGMGVTFAARAGRAFRVTTDRAQVLPLAVCSATVLGLMVSMYTVWAGAVYAVVWIVMLGLSNALIDTVMSAAAARAGGLPVVTPLRPPTVRLPVAARVNFGA